MHGLSIMNQKYSLIKSIFGYCISLSIGQSYHSKQMKVYCVINKLVLQKHLHLHAMITNRIVFTNIYINVCISQKELELNCFPFGSMTLGRWRIWQRFFSRYNNVFSRVSFQRVRTKDVFTRKFETWMFLSSCMGDARQEQYISFQDVLVTVEG